MKTCIRLSVLADNTVLAGNTMGEHGLAFCVDTDEKCILFDTGQGRVLLANAEVMQLNLDAVDTVILSHGHYDHTGGLGLVLRNAASPVTVITHPDARLSRFYNSDSGVRDISMPSECQTALLGDRCKIITSKVPVEVSRGIWTTGEVPRKYKEEQISEPFFLDSECAKPDPIMDDQAVYIATDSGTVVLLGCAHSGVINTLDHIKTLTGEKPIRSVIGGMHLRASDDVRLRWTLKKLAEFEIGIISPMHCTGYRAFAAIFSAFPLACRPCGAGMVMNF